MRLLAFGPVVLVLVTIAAVGQNSPPRLSDFQSWDELDISARVTDNVDVSWISQGRFSADYANPATALTGAEVAVALGSHVVVAPSYYYLAFKTTSGKSGHFEVPLFAATLRLAHGRWTLSDRSRFLGAIGGGNNSWLYLNRPRFDYQIGPRRWGASAFVWDEVFYFSLFDGWTRNRAAAGMKKVFNRHWATDLYYLRQDDSKTQPRVINGIGFTVEVRVR